MSPAKAIVLRSSRYPPTICTPIGRPLSLRPFGIVVAGRPFSVAMAAQADDAESAPTFSFSMTPPRKQRRRQIGANVSSNDPTTSRPALGAIGSKGEQPHDTPHRSTLRPNSVAVAARDALIRDTLDELDGSLRARAVQLAAALAGHRATYWSRERRTGAPADASQRHLALFEILRLDRGRALCSWRLQEIADAERRAPASSAAA
jgi:hypothetical protein